jgi:PD-(D/E)XK nuclease superfamily
MTQHLLSRNKLTTFLACQRQFQLHYLERRAWPEAPLPEADEERLDRGQQFHQLVQRHFLGLSVEAAAIEDRTLRRWWLAFEQNKPELPGGRLLPELTLTIPIGSHLLHGRFDLLVIGEENGLPFAHIFDWKTGKPPDETTLRHDWQTRLYLAMLAEGGQALWANNPAIQPDHIAITYWYATAPDEPITIPYNHAWHERNWAELMALVAQIEAQLAQDGVWPLTDDWSLCRVCAYQALCGRQGAGTAVILADEETDDFFAFHLEPELP